MFNKSFKASLILLATLTAAGCSTAPAQLESEHAPARAQAVYIVPNCQSIGGESVCHWIIPNGHAAETTQPQKTVEGISL